MSSLTNYDQHVRGRASKHFLRTVFLFTLMLCLSSSVYQIKLLGGYSTADQVDFSVYYTAARLVHTKEDAAIYTGGKRGVDPQLQIAAAGTQFAQTASTIGVGQVQLYLYPPFLADALIPIQYLSFTRAQLVWRLFNLALGALIAWLLARLLGANIFGWTNLACLLAVFSFRPFWMGIYVGQIAGLICALLTGSLVAYCRGHKTASAALLGAAVAIKLTPMLCILPMLMWREWKWLRAFAATVGILLIGAVWQNGTDVSLVFWRRIMPPMSVGVRSVVNTTISSVIQQVVLTEHWHLTARQAGITSKVLAVTLLMVVLWRIRTGGLAVPRQSRMLILSTFSLLSAFVSPVAWPHAYLCALPLLALLWHGAFYHGATRTQILTLAIFTLALDCVGVARVLEHAGLLRLAAFLIAAVWIIWSMQSMCAQQYRIASVRGLMQAS